MYWKKIEIKLLKAKENLLLIQKEPEISHYFSLTDRFYSHKYHISFHFNLLTCCIAIHFFFHIGVWVITFQFLFHFFNTKSNQMNGMLKISISNLMWLLWIRCEGQIRFGEYKALRFPLVVIAVAARREKICSNKASLFVFVDTRMIKKGECDKDIFTASANKISMLRWSKMWEVWKISDYWWDLFCMIFVAVFDVFALSLSSGAVGNTHNS